MSSTNRGATRTPNDFYPTPDWLTAAICPYLGNPQTIFEPACGEGAITRVLRAYFPASVIQGSDILFGPEQDFLQMRPQPVYDLIITNPPFSLAKEFIDCALGWRRTEESLVVMLLRLNFLGSQDRAPWWRARPLPSVYVTPRRPPFGKNKNGKPGTDSTEYAWFIWGLRDAHYEILHTEKT